ncbi:hypothetical protein CYMTET_8528 [Cymbomonas tetramitiformis]|uniref:Uncharacterized protein n=1 Tax=Cymbomonas tetramitiformis TaxID=36881 RepID=A0AAE0GT54_9CHLO|nr:hypothetical protein CYMTET_8528 [Cymbomonas tetramitiformis]
MQALWRMLQKRVHPLNPQFRHYAQPLSWTTRGHMHTTGMTGVLLLMHHCRHVNVFGFRGKRLTEWYYNKRPKGLIPKKLWLRTTVWEVNSTGPGDGDEDALEREEGFSSVGQEGEMLTYPTMGTSPTKFSIHTMPLADNVQGRAYKYLHVGVKRKAPKQQIAQPEQISQESVEQETENAGDVTQGLSRRKLLNHNIKVERQCMQALHDAGLISLR